VLLIRLSAPACGARVLVEQMVDGLLEGLVVKDGRSPYRDGSRSGWFKVKDRGWYEREAWRFER
jgi:ATP-dependent DNA ligase